METGRRPSSSTGTRPTRRIGCRSWSGSKARPWPSISPAGAARHAHRRRSSTTRWTASPGSRAASCSGWPSSDYSLVVHDWGAVGLIARPGGAGAGQAPRDHQRGGLAARIPLAPDRADLADARPRRALAAGSRRVDLLVNSGCASHEGTGAGTTPRSSTMVLATPRPGTASKRSCASTAPRPRGPPRRRRRAPRDSINCPALVVWGLRDRYLPARFGAAYAAALPNSELWSSRAPGTGPGSRILGSSTGWFGSSSRDEEFASA